MDRLQSMAAFLKVAELGSFSAAAEQMGLSKSAVSGACAK
ncbi:MAG: LysR family transcriptional regulator [Betaproteobacteria bacterium]|nr:LysR family transcriptional regulator [Betaproteobacteria bacterium]